MVIGRVISTTPEYEARLYKDSLFKHILVIGATGSGKSNTASVIASRVSRSLGVRVIVLDWHSEYTSILQEYELIDPFDTPLELFTGDPSDLSVLSSILELTPPQEYLLDKITRKIPIDRISSVESLLGIIENYPEEATWMRETKLSLHRKLSLLTRENYSVLFTIQGSSRLKDLTRIDQLKPFIVDLGAIRDPGIRRLYGAFFAKRIVDLAIDHGVSLVLVIEEAQNYLSRSQPVKPLSDMIREMRKFNIGIVVVSQSVSQLVDDVSTNTNTKIIHSLKSNQDLEIIGRTLYLDSKLLETIPYMEPGEAVYSEPYLKKPVLVKIEKESWSQDSA